MKFEVDGIEAYASTGGKDHVPGQTYLIFMHGTGASHVVWSQQARSFAYGGYNVVAVDFPGHNFSAGDPLKTVEDQAAWIVKVMDALDIDKGVLVGHSQGGLVALAAADLAPERMEKIAFVATAAAIPVNDYLINTAETKEPKAKSAMTAWGLGPDAHHYNNTIPGYAHVGVGLRIMDFNPDGVVANDLKACAAFENGLEMAAKITCPTLCVLAGKDKMTPLRSGMKLADALQNNTLHVLKGSGHTVPTERAHELNEHLRNFLE